MKSLLPLRAVLVTGKGGVGKTTVTASLARFAAAQGKRVLCAEMVGDPAASSALADALEAGIQPTLAAYPALPEAERLAALDQVLAYYLRRRYVLRLQGQIGGKVTDR